jgi:hypothetical protein
MIPSADDLAVPAGLRRGGHHRYAVTRAAGLYAHRYLGT